VKKFKVKSFCKINLSLKVSKNKRNGYHRIDSLITFCRLYDLITISRIKSAQDEINFSGNFKKGISKKINTITRVLYLLRNRKYIKKDFFRINVKKNIPHGSGLGGGSSNAASLLNFLNSKINLNINKKEINKIASQVGFDAPISLQKKNTIIIGRNNKILRIKQRFGLNILIVYPNLICSTKKIYNRNKNFSLLSKKNYFSFSNKKKLIYFLQTEGNDLEKAVTTIYPEVQNIINFIKIQKGCYFSRITGSGSACIGIFHDMKSAIFTQKLIKLKFPKYWCVVSKTM